MQSFLTVNRLETLYNSEQSQVLIMLFAEVAKLKSKRRKTEERSGEMNLTIHDVGIAIRYSILMMISSGQKS